MTFHELSFAEFQSMLYRHVGDMLQNIRMAKYPSGEIVPDDQMSALRGSFEHAIESALDKFYPRPKPDVLYRDRDLSGDFSVYCDYSCRHVKNPDCCGDDESCMLIKAFELAKGLETDSYFTLDDVFSKACELCEEGPYRCYDENCPLADFLNDIEQVSLEYGGGR